MAPPSFTALAAHIKDTQQRPSVAVCNVASAEYGESLLGAPARVNSQLSCRKEPGHGRRDFSPLRRAVTSPSTAHSDAGRETSTWPSQLLGTLGASPAAGSSADSNEERARARASRKSTASCSLRSAEMSCVGRCGKVGVGARVSEYT